MAPSRYSLTVKKSQKIKSTSKLLVKWMAFCTASAISWERKKESIKFRKFEIQRKTKLIKHIHKIICALACIFFQILLFKSTNSKFSWHLFRSRIFSYNVQQIWEITYFKSTKLYCEEIKCFKLFSRNMSGYWNVLEPIHFPEYFTDQTIDLFRYEITL